MKLATYYYKKSPKYMKENKTHMIVISCPNSCFWERKLSKKKINIRKALTLSIQQKFQNLHQLNRHLNENRNFLKMVLAEEEKTSIKTQNSKSYILNPVIDRNLPLGLQQI